MASTSVGTIVAKRNSPILWKVIGTFKNKLYLEQLSGVPTKPTNKETKIVSRSYFNKHWKVRLTMNFQETNESYKNKMTVKAIKEELYGVQRENNH